MSIDAKNDSLGDYHRFLPWLSLRYQAGCTNENANAQTSGRFGPGRRV